MKLVDYKSLIAYRKSILDRDTSKMGGPEISERGFSLVEVVLGALVVVLVVFIIMNIPPSINLIGRSKQESLAKDIALKKIELLRSSEYGVLANGVTPISDPRLASLPNSLGQATIEDCPVDICTQGEIAKRVTVKITWKNSGDTKKIELVTLLTDGGIQ